MVSVVAKSLVVSLDLRPGVRVAAAWDGCSPTVEIHAVTGCGFGLVVDSLRAVDDTFGEPLIEPTLDALEAFVVSRLEQSGEMLADMVADVAAWSEAREEEPVFHSVT